MTNRLYFGDCLDVMREDIPDESVDLIYLDPPFNSKRLYNAFLGGAQWVAFDDTWRWYEAIDDFHECAADVALAPTMEGLRAILGEGPNLAYLSYMANRLRECRRVLRDTGSIYLHCDPTMSHYLKIIMDGLFGRRQFRNEIVWFYRRWANASNKWQSMHDTIFFYSRGRDVTFNRQYIETSKTRSAMKRGYNTNTYERGGQRVRQIIVEDERAFARAVESGKVDPAQFERVVRRKSEGTPAPDVFEIPVLNPQAKERIGYPTQKPLALLERILRASSNPGDVVLDPFCGCGTTLHAAQNLERQWIGIDVCVNACKVIEERLRQHFDSLWSDIEFIGMPKTGDDARELAHLDAFRFERWAASLVDGVEANTRQRGDGGIDGRGRIPIRKGEFIDLVSQVKGGSTGPGDVQAFNGARQQAGADLGIFTCFEDRVTHGMRDAAASAGRFMDVPAIQIYTVEDFFGGRRPLIPVAA